MNKDVVAEKLVFTVLNCVLTVVVVAAVILKNQMQVKNQTTVKGKLINGLWVLFHLMTLICFGYIVVIFF